MNILKYIILSEATKYVAYTVRLEIPVNVFFFVLYFYYYYLSHFRLRYLKLLLENLDLLPHYGIR